MEDIRIQFGSLLKKLRKANGVTQEELAFRAELDVSYLSNLENGRSSPSLAMIVDLACGLGVQPFELLVGMVVDQKPERERRPDRKRRKDE
ncbi:helix-turn-helix transcriptional regulator [Nitrospirillum sp. BR 11828]|uniref:helix-turn-helix domain-containing protein n=1 Tax=Nitrospirillum sp. BR 11828 TaxID=3104325 RepID=UPI002ACA71EF|nr:helix-turn-helix transcriptional regulator [Nitrospirillum sp. BR 11828]MDZ5649425.1 helix-turn-helix transcriptional regulator [Nitrospirillum sp. BR 11828]